MSAYTTKATWLGTRYGCRVYFKGRLLVEAFCKSREDIGPTFRDLLRTVDKCGGDAFSASARKRKYRQGNRTISVKHHWSR